MSFVNVGGGSNVYVPEFSEATGDIQVAFSRNPTRFALNRYARFVSVTDDVGYYLKIDAKQQVRFLSGGLSQYQWPLGQPRPTGQNIPFDLNNQYQCQRLNYGWGYPLERVKQARWSIEQTHFAAKAMTAMTGRTILAATRLGTAGSWTESGTKYATIAALGTAAGITITGNYAAAEGNIRKMFLSAGIVIHQNTAGAVNPATDIIAVMNPITAALLATTAELTNYIQTTPFAPQYMEGSRPYAWGLAPALFGMADIVIEDATTITTPMDASSDTKGWCIPTNVIVFVSRPGGMMANDAAVPTFATLTGFICSPYDMSAWSWENPRDAILEGAIVDWPDFRVTSPLSGVYIDDITA